MLARRTTLAAALLAAALPASGPAQAATPNPGAPKAAPSGVSASKLKKLKRRVAALRQQVDALVRPTGPQGPPGSQGPEGTAPGCAGNGSGDVMVSAGAVCIDRYEVSVWSSPTGGTQYGTNSDDYPCSDTGQKCTGGNAVYARSVAGVAPSRFITWFQAQQALANSGKRLPSNAEWQQAVAGTPDSSACNVGTQMLASTGANTGCVSNFGANDMVGNLYEYVGDWVPYSNNCTTWGTVGTFSSNDTMCLSGADTTTPWPGALVRSGTFNFSTPAGPFAVSGSSAPPASSNLIGFRGAR